MPQVPCGHCPPVQSLYDVVSHDLRDDTGCSSGSLCGEKDTCDASIVESSRLMSKTATPCRARARARSRNFYFDNISVVFKWVNANDISF